MPGRNDVGSDLARGETENLRDALDLMAPFKDAARFAVHHGRTWWPAFAAGFPEGASPVP